MIEKPPRNMGKINMKVINGIGYIMFLFEYLNVLIS